MGVFRGILRDEMGAIVSPEVVTATVNGKPYAPEHLEHFIKVLIVSGINRVEIEFEGTLQGCDDTHGVICISIDRNRTTKFDFVNGLEENMTQQKNVWKICCNALHDLPQTLKWWTFDIRNSLETKRFSGGEEVVPCSFLPSMLNDPLWHTTRFDSGASVVSIQTQTGYMEFTPENPCTIPGFAALYHYVGMIHINPEGGWFAGSLSLGDKTFPLHVFYHPALAPEKLVENSTAATGVRVQGKGRKVEEMVQTLYSHGVNSMLEAFPFWWKLVIDGAPISSPGRESPDPTFHLGPRRIATESFVVDSFADTFRDLCKCGELRQFPGEDGAPVTEVSSIHDITVVKEFSEFMTCDEIEELVRLMTRPPAPPSPPPAVPLTPPTPDAFRVGEASTEWSMFGSMWADRSKKETPFVGNAAALSNEEIVAFDALWKVDRAFTSVHIATIRRIIAENPAFDTHTYFLGRVNQCVSAHAIRTISAFIHSEFGL